MSLSMLALRVSACIATVVPAGVAFAQGTRGSEPLETVVVTATRSEHACSMYRHR